MRVALLMPVLLLPPRQRNTRDENEQIKQGAADKLWNDNLHKKRHKNVDARRTKKRDETFMATSSIPKLRNTIRSYLLMIPRRQKCMIPKALKDCLIIIGAQKKTNLYIRRYFHW